MALKPLNNLPETPLTITRALLSVSDKTGLLPLAQALHKNNTQLFSTGGTAAAIRDAGIPVTDVSEVTGFPECLDGRVKTLHPAVHAGILARTSYKPDSDELEKLGYHPFELVVVNLYPFKKTVSDKSVTPEIATENIDIGGPTMIRAAAKNFAHVCVLSSPSQYESFISGLNENNTVSFELRRTFAREAFQHTADYDASIANYFNRLDNTILPGQLNISLTQSSSLRYGENPHQMASVYGDQTDFIDCFHGKELSYNNYLDIDAALNLMSDFKNDDPTVAIFKHTVPCGVAADPSLLTAWSKAFSTDTVSPFGGIVVTNREVDLETATAIDQIFTEIILAPSFSNEAKIYLEEKKNRRLVSILKFPESENSLQIRSVFGGALLQQTDNGSGTTSSFETVTKRKPDNQELADMIFAWKVVKHVKSNAIVFARNGQTLGIGTGQTSRVDSSKIAVAKARSEGQSLEGSVIASDAFFPFSDGIEAAAEAGARSVIQPGGSIRDEEVIETANKLNLSMIFTGMRHFKH